MTLLATSSKILKCDGVSLAHRFVRFEAVDASSAVSKFELNAIGKFISYSKRLPFRNCRIS